MLSHQIINVFSPLFAFNLHSKAYIAYKRTHNIKTKKKRVAVIKANN